MRATLELFGLELDVDIGTYQNDRAVSYKHVLDLTVSVDPALVLIKADKMSQVFDYDGLIESIEALGSGVSFETQEMLATVIVKLCAEYAEIQNLVVALRKISASDTRKKIGVTLSLDAGDLAQIRQQRA